MIQSSPEYQALLRACRANLLDDTPRLVLADWLDEHDDPARAQFIRIQCELARPSFDVVKLDQLREVEAQLLKENWSDWAGELPQLIRALDVERYIETQRLLGNPVSPLMLPEELRAIDPLNSRNSWRFERGMLMLHIRYQELNTPAIRDWLQSEEAQCLMQIQTDTQVISDLQKLKIDPVVAPFLSLRLHLVVVSSMRLTALKGDNFKLVRHLDIEVRDNAPKVFQQLCQAEFRHISELSLSGSFLDPEFAANLLNNNWESLARLDLQRTNFSTTFWERLFSTKQFDNLMELSIYRNPLGDSGAKALAKHAAKNLTAVELMNCQIGDEGFIALLQGGLLSRLAGPQFNFTMNHVGDEGAKQLAQTPEVGRFSELVLRENKIGDVGAMAMAFSPHLSGLTYMDFWKNRIGDIGAEAFVKSPHWQRIQALNLRDNPISPAMKEELFHRFGTRVKL